MFCGLKLCAVTVLNICCFFFCFFFAANCSLLLLIDELVCCGSEMTELLTTKKSVCLCNSVVSLLSCCFPKSELVANFTTDHLNCSLAFGVLELLICPFESQFGCRSELLICHYAALLLAMYADDTCSWKAVSDLC